MMRLWNQATGAAAGFSHAANDTAPTTLNLLPSIATLASSANRPVARQSATNRAQTRRMARPLSLRKSAIVL